jgi:phage gp37-like protein
LVFCFNFILLQKVLQTMRRNLLSRIKVSHLESLHRSEVTKPNLVKNILNVLSNQKYIGELTISETIDIINLCNLPTSNYNYIWEMFNEN